MNRKTAEKLIAKLLHAIVEIYLTFDPDATYLSLCFIKDAEGSYISFDNCPHKAETPINYREHF
jgi:hypothetical protein